MVSANRLAGAISIRHDGEVDTLHEERLVGRSWRRVFLLEIPICAGSVLYWVGLPDVALRTIHGLDAPDPVHASLLAQLGFVVLAVFVWFYARWLLSGRVALRPFRYFQEGASLSDALLIWAAFDGLAREALMLLPGLAQATMATLWLGIRVVFLVSTREPAGRRGAGGLEAST